MSAAMGFAALVDAVVDAGLAAGRVVGVVVLVRERGTLVYERAAGYADREAGTPMAVNTVFRIASLTKPLVAVTALALVERGRLRLDDPVTRFLPGFRPRLVDGSAPVILIRHLLTHTAGFGYPEAPGPEQDAGSGLPVDRYWAAGVSTGLDLPGMSLEDNLRRIASVPLYFPPGEGWRYGVATDVLGAVIAAVHGGSLAQAVSEFVTGPLSMNDTAFTVRDRSRLAVPYADGNPRATRMTDPQILQGFRLSPSRAFDDESFQSGGAGMVGTAPDFMAFLETIRTQGEPILRHSTVQSAGMNQVGDLRAEEPGWGFGFLSGVLIDPQTAATPQAPGTLNWGGVWGHQWFVDKSAGLSVTICTNTALEGCTGRFPLEVRDAIYAARASETR
jgi:CubicO group peptidase (beta-lactamase class C family)